MKREVAEIPRKLDALVLAYVSRKYTNSRAEEFAKHGIARRLKVLARCVENVFRHLPPDRETPATASEITDAIISIQAFLTNLLGLLDNLAWLWVCESSLALEDGSPLPRLKVGLDRQCERVRNSFSQEFRAQLDEFEPWLRIQTDFRNALAHRIPPYIPPYVIPAEKLEQYQRLERDAIGALARGEFTKYERLEKEKALIARFGATMTHSFSEEARHIVFHAQLIADFNTAELLAKKMLGELDRFSVQTSYFT